MPIPSRCVCQPQPYCFVKMRHDDLRQTARDAGGGGHAPPWWTTTAIRGNSWCIAVTNCDYSLGQRAMGRGPDTVQYHAATPSDPERLRQ